MPEHVFTITQAYAPGTPQPIRGYRDRGHFARESRANRAAMRVTRRRHARMRRGWVFP